VARAVAHNPRRTKPVEKHAVPRSPATNCSAARSAGTTHARVPTLKAGHAVPSDRADKRGDVAELDAPLAAGGKKGISTILDGEPGDSIQNNLGEK